MTNCTLLANSQVNTPAFAKWFYHALLLEAGLIWPDGTERSGGVWDWRQERE